MRSGRRSRTFACGQPFTMSFVTRWRVSLRHACVNARDVRGRLAGGGPPRDTARRGVRCDGRAAARYGGAAGETKACEAEAARAARLPSGGARGVVVRAASVARKVHGSQRDGFPASSPSFAIRAKRYSKEFSSFI